MLDPRIKLRHIKAFVETTRRESVVGAADALHLTQPAISKSLKELETILAVRLLERSRAGVTLTPIGEMFLHYARAGLAAWQQGVDAVAQALMSGDATLAIGALPSVAASIIPEAMRLFLDDARGVTPKIVSGPNDYLLDQLRLGRLDLLVGRLGEPSSMAGLSFTQLYTEQVSLIVRPGHPMLATPVLDRLADHLVLIPEKDAAIRQIAERFLISHGIGNLPRRMETVADTFGRSFVRQSDAVWFISSGVVALDLAEGHLMELAVDTAQTLGPVGLTRRDDNVPTPALRYFIGCLRAAADSRSSIG